MTTATLETPVEIDRFIGRYTDKIFDWDAFPSNRGYAELDRGQIRYVGAGGSPKHDDPRTLKPGAFTVSIIHQPVGKYAACHMHEIEEAFLVLGGVMTVGWRWDDEVVEARLGPKDMVLNMAGRPHGFRNDGVEPVDCSIMVGKHKPAPPVYLAHPKSSDPVLARHFGVPAETVRPLIPGADDPRHRDFARHVVRYAEQPVLADPAGFLRKVYIGEGGAPAGGYRKDLIHLPAGRGVRLYDRAVEDTYFVLEGVVTAGWETPQGVVERRLGVKDLVFNPPGQPHYFRNDGVAAAQFMMIVGTPERETVRFQAA